MTEGLKASLRQTLIFADFSEDELDAVAKQVTERLLKKGTTVFHEGQPGLAFYIIKTGRVKVFKLAEDGRELILGIFGDGALFGDVPVFDGGPYPAGAASSSSLKSAKISVCLRLAFNPSVISPP
ncbi:MAG TPA: cyclic nucleotide-binding domain-containing protein [Actinobacteria bacterium]|nr:cyclic nucleotide-binding domain-containing protein [Actinomycetota bacterium]